MVHVFCRDEHVCVLGKTTGSVCFGHHARTVHPHVYDYCPCHTSTALCACPQKNPVCQSTFLERSSNSCLCPHGAIGKPVDHQSHYRLTQIERVLVLPWRRTDRAIRIGK